MNKVFLCDVRYIIKDDRMLGVIPRWCPAKLNLLDDDLIGEVEYLRSRKKSRRKQWMSWAAMAACMCIVIGSILSGRLPIEIGQNSESADMEHMSNSAGGNEESAESELPIQAEGVINEEKRLIEEYKICKLV